VTRARNQSESLITALTQVGAIPISFPTIQHQQMRDLREVDAGIRAALDADWVVFTSANGVRAVADRVAITMEDRWRPQRIAAVGPVTASALGQLALVANLIPGEYHGGALAAALGKVSGLSIVLLRASAAQPTLANDLRSAGAEVLDVPVYRTEMIEPDQGALDELGQGVDVVTFTSSSTVHGFVSALGAGGRSLTDSAIVATIGPITTATAISLGMSVEVEATESTTDGLIQALVGHF